MALTKVTGEGVGTLTSGISGTDITLSGGVNIFNSSTDSIDIRATGNRCEIDNPDNNSILLKTGGTTRIRIDPNGLLFGSDTAAANALDDYEEGTWTPAVTFGGAAVGVAYTANTNGRYVKVGGVVYVSGCLFLSNKGSSTGSAAITGLPFAHLNSSEGTKASGSIGQTNISFTAFPSILGSGSSLLLFDTTTGGTLGAIDNSNFGNNSSVYFNASYATA